MEENAAGSRRPVLETLTPQALQPMNEGSSRSFLASRCCRSSMHCTGSGTSISPPMVNTCCGFFPLFCHIRMCTRGRRLLCTWSLVVSPGQAHNNAERWRRVSTILCSRYIHSLIVFSPSLFVHPRFEIIVHGNLLQRDVIFKSSKWFELHLPGPTVVSRLDCWV